MLLELKKICSKFIALCREKRERKQRAMIQMKRLSACIVRVK